MERTPNFGLYKPGTDDFINIDDLNANMDIIDDALANISSGAPVNAMVATFSAGQSVIGDLSVIEEG